MSTFNGTDAWWTIAYRKPRANRFQRASDFAGTWAQAWELAGRYLAAHPGLEVYYTVTQAYEDSRPRTEDTGNILTGTGRRVRIAEGGTLGGLEPLDAAAAQDAWENDPNVVRI